jgi:hypothetical protein
MNIYVKNNRNELLTNGKVLFIETPVFTDVSGNVLPVNVDGVSFSSGSKLSDGDHTLTYLTDTLTFSIYSVRLYWGAEYLKSYVIDENIIGLGENNISTNYKTAQDLAKYPHLFILPVGRTETGFINAEEIETTLQYQILLEAYIEGNNENEWRRIWEIIDRISTLANKSETQGLGCFSVSIDFPDFSISDVKAVDTDNGRLFVQADGVLGIKIMNIRS